MEGDLAIMIAATEDLLLPAEDRRGASTRISASHCLIPGVFL